MQYSVLMSVYIKEKPKYLHDSLKSIFEQTMMPSEVVLVEDGPVTQDIKNVIDDFKDKFGDILNVIELEKNVGLGNALNIGVEKCRYPIIARMDTDDIAKPTRCEKQLKEFEKNADLDICGTFIEEFEDTIDNIVSIRKPPCTHREIINFSKKRNPFNHMTVMFKRESVLKAGNYQEVNLFEDYYLWIRMIVNGAKTCNIPESLVFARVGSEMMKRRGGLSYWKKIVNGRKKIRDTGFISFFEFIYLISIQFIFCLSPLWLRDKLYKKFLRG